MLVNYCLRPSTEGWTDLPGISSCLITKDFKESSPSTSCPIGYNPGRKTQQNTPSFFCSPCCLICSEYVYRGNAIEKRLNIIHCNIGSRILILYYNIDNANPFSWKHSSVS